MNFKRKRIVLLQNGDTVRNQVKKLLILISFLLLSSPVIGEETGVLYQYETSTGIEWRTFGDYKIQPKYNGEIKDFKPNGQGIITYTDGREYVGEWSGGTWNGQGKYTFKDGFGYEGEWKNGTENGMGYLTYPNGDKYIGQFKNGKMMNGKMYKKNRDIHTQENGKWKMENGKWKMENGKWKMENRTKQ